jgi:hypothetical protein
MKLVAIPRIHARDFRPSRWGGEPRVVIDNVRSWKALDRWRPEYLKAVAGERDVRLRETDGPPRNLFQNLAEGGLIPLAEYLDWVLATADDLKEIADRYTDPADITRAVCASDFEHSYYLDYTLEKLSKVLLDDTEPPAWYRTDPMPPIFWCGVIGTSSGLHCDVYPNCNVQVVGRKHFSLFAPSESGLLYPRPNLAHCYFDPNVPDFDAFPLARGATAWQCTLEPGESLYIPPGWYHQVTVASSWAINVNFFWPRPLLQEIATPLLWRILFMRGSSKVRATLRDRLRPAGARAA